MSLRIVTTALCLTLAGCAAQAVKPAAGDAIAGEAAQRERAAALGLATGDCGAPGWSMAGRVALSAGKEGGSGRLEWTQGAGLLRLQLSAPVTRQGWLLEVDAEGATLHGLPDGTRHGDDAARLLREAVGWDIPVAALGCWLRAVAAGEAAFGQAQIDYGTDLLPQRIGQGGWTIEYTGWQPDPFTRLPMPSRIEARNGDNRVRLVVDRWGVE
ncbi:MAG: lipoprotein insertase outer membrane protein LolB [Thermomonas sp.]|uniref:lipoprotein insertase outer membrane protein LolB n=1 Tax=Thermomonas sp. TaxID=1971895 RepID=UPI0039E6D9DB